MNGKHEVLSISIKPEAVDPDDIEMLEDMMAAAINATVKQVDETAEAEMGKLTCQCTQQLPVRPALPSCPPASSVPDA